MDSDSEQTLAHLIRDTRLAALGTIHNGEPNLAMVAIAHESDFSAFYLHVSKLGKHTTDMENDPHVSLLLTEADDHRPDPQTLARVSIQGMATVLPRNDPVMLASKCFISHVSRKRSNYSVWAISIFGESRRKVEDLWRDLGGRSTLYRRL